MGSQVTFGLFPVFGQWMFQPVGLSPVGVGVWRLVGGSVFLLPMALLASGKRVLPARSDVLVLVLAGWCGVALNQILYLEGLSRSTPINAALMTCLIPVFTFGLAAAVRQEAFSPVRLAGILLALGATLLLVVERGVTGLG